MALKITKDNFDAEVVNSDRTVLIDFYADWCMPCKMLAPVIDEISRENTQVKVCKVNIDDEQDLAEEFGIMSIPTLVVMKDGEIINTSVGVRSKAEILEKIK